MLGTQLDLSLVQVVSMFMLVTPRNSVFFAPVLYVSPPSKILLHFYSSTLKFRLANEWAQIMAVELSFACVEVWSDAWSGMEVDFCVKPVSGGCMVATSGILPVCNKSGSLLEAGLSDVVFLAMCTWVLWEYFFCRCVVVSLGCHF